MAAIDKSIYEKFIIEAADQSKTVDISAGVIAFTYFENITIFNSKSNSSKYRWFYYGR